MKRINEDLKKYRKINEAQSRGTFEIQHGVMGVDWEDGVAKLLDPGTYELLTYGGQFVELKKKGTLLQPSFLVHINDLPMASFNTEIQESRLKETNQNPQIRRAFHASCWNVFRKFGKGNDLFVWVTPSGDEKVVFSWQGFYRMVGLMHFDTGDYEIYDPPVALDTHVFLRGGGRREELIRAELPDRLRVKENLNEGYERHCVDVLNAAGIHDIFFEFGTLYYYSTEDPDDIADALQNSGEIYKLPPIKSAYQRNVVNDFSESVNENLNEGYESHIKDILDKAGLDGYFENGILYTPDDPSEIAHALKSSGEIYKLPEIRPTNR